MLRAVISGFLDISISGGFGGCRLLVSTGLDVYASLGFDWLCFGVWQSCGGGWCCCYSW